MGFATLEEIERSSKVSTSTGENAGTDTEADATTSATTTWERSARSASTFIATKIKRQLVEATTFNDDAAAASAAISMLLFFL